MRFFRRLRTEVDVEPLLSEIHSQEYAWLADTSRQSNISVQRNTESIFLRVGAKRRDIELRDNQATRSTLMCATFPLAVAFMESVAQEFGATLERAAIVRLKPKSIVYPHTDSGSYYFLRDRFHLVLASPKGSLLSSGDEQVRMRPGELWWFDNKQHHWAAHEGDDWRIHYIFDLLPSGFRHFAVNPMAPVAANQPPELAPQVSVPVPSHNDSTLNYLKETIRERAVLSSEQSLLISSSGRPYRWMLDMRRVTTNATALDALADVFWTMFGHKYPFQVGGLETAAIPLLSAIQIKSVARGTPINGFIVRKERKSYGAGQLIEGQLDSSPIIIVDDILNSGRSVENVRSVLDAYDRQIDEVFVAVDYMSKLGMEWRAEHGVSVTSPLTLSDFDLVLESRPEQPTQRPILLRRWRFVSPGGNFYHRLPKSFPATDNERVYFGSDSGAFWALNARSGAVAWTFQVHSEGKKNIWSAPALHNGSVCFGSYDGNVYCLNSATGEEKWRFTEADWIGSSPAIAPDLGLLFIGLEFSTPGKQGSIVALDLTTGNKRWEYPTVRYTHASPAYCPERGVVACGSNNNELFLFDAETGNVRWRFETRGDGRKGSIRHAPAFDMARGTVITGSADGYIYILDLITGEEVWNVRTGNEIYTVPLCHGDLAFVGSTDKHIYVLDLVDRVVKRRHAVSSKVYAPPRLVKGAIYVGACNGSLYKLDPDDAEITGRYQLPDAVTNAVAYSEENNLLYALTYVNELFALSPV